MAPLDPQSDIHAATARAARWVRVWTTLWIVSFVVPGLVQIVRDPQVLPFLILVLPVLVGIAGFQLAGRVRKGETLVGTRRFLIGVQIYLLVGMIVTGIVLAQGNTQLPMFIIFIVLLWQIVHLVACIVAVRAIRVAERTDVSAAFE